MSSIMGDFKAILLLAAAVLIAIGYYLHKKGVCKMPVKPKSRIYVPTPSINNHGQNIELKEVK